jgi:hypothetical protein
MTQEHAYIYCYNGKSVLVEVFSKDIMKKGYKAGTKAIAKVTKDFKLTLPSQREGRICIHSGNAILIDLIKSSKITGLRVHGGNEVAFTGIKGSITPRESSVNFIHGMEFGDFSLDYKDAYELTVGDTLFGNYDDPIVAQVK